MQNSLEDSVFVRLLNEGTDVWRPARAERLLDSAFRLLAPTNYEPEDEEWEFPPGSMVACELRTIGGERRWVAVRPVPGSSVG